MLIVIALRFLWAWSHSHTVYQHIVSEVFDFVSCWSNEGNEEKLAAPACRTSGTLFFVVFLWHNLSAQVLKASWQHTHTVAITTTFFLLASFEAFLLLLLFLLIPGYLDFPAARKCFLMKNLLWVSWNNDALNKEWHRGFWLRPGLTSTNSDSLAFLSLHPCITRCYLRCVIFRTKAGHCIVTLTQIWISMTIKLLYSYHFPKTETRRGCEVFPRQWVQVEGFMVASVMWHTKPSLCLNRFSVLVIIISSVDSALQFHPPSLSIQFPKYWQIVIMAREKPIIGWAHQGRQNGVEKH